MFKVIVERPRFGHGDSYPRRWMRHAEDCPLEDAPQREPLGRRYGRKCLSENLAPLVRFLRTNAGRPWSKVRSELATHISCTSAVQKHVLDHVRQYVEENVTYDRARPMRVGHGGWEPIVSRGRHPSFYVCPRSGLLRVAPVRPRKPRAEAPNPNRIALSETNELRRIDGHWYRLTVAPMPRYDEAGYDVVARKSVHKLAWTERHDDPVWRSGRYFVAKRQLSKRDIERLVGHR